MTVVVAGQGSWGLCVFSVKRDARNVPDRDVNTWVRTEPWRSRTITPLMSSLLLHTSGP